MRRRLSIALLLFLALSLLLPVTAAASSGERLSYVTDQAGLLSEEQRLALEERAAQMSERYQCGVYIVIVQDYREFNRGSISSCAEEIYDQYLRGFGETGDGILFLISMADRDYDLDAHGSFGNYAFSSHGRDALVDAFAPYFRGDDWYNGFLAYLNAAEQLLIPAEQGYPAYLESLQQAQQPHMSGAKAAGAAAAGALAAAGSCAGMKHQMKTAREKTTAEEYMTPTSPHMHIVHDQFINRTRTVQIIQQERSSDSGGHSGGGFSGHSHTSGKF